MCLLSIPSSKPVSYTARDESTRPYVGPQNVPVLLDPTLFESFTWANLCALLANSFLPY